MPDRRGASERFLTTVLMTDIVGSTEHAAELGDSAWRELVQLHHQLVRATLRRHSGREIDTAGDGFFAIFDAPAAAIACVLEISTGVKGLGIDIRAGVHVGEVEQIGPKVGGIAVSIAARIMSAAEPSEVLVSATVRDLSAGARLHFEDRGTRELKGVPGEWHIFAVRPAQSEAEPSAGSVDKRATRRAAAVRHARSRPVWQRRPRLVAATALSLTLVLATSALLVWKPWQSPALAAIEEDSVGVIDAGRSEIVASIPVDESPGGLAIADAMAWVSNTGADTVSQIDTNTGSVTRVIDVGRAPLGIAAEGGSIWVANSGGRTVTRINAETARVVGTLTVGNGPVAIAGHGGTVWVANLTDNTVVGIDAASGSLSAPIRVPGGPVALAADDTGVWVASAATAVLAHLDASGTSLAAPLALPSRPAAIAIGAGAVWVAGADGTLTRVDPVAARITATVDVGGSLSAIALAGNDVWLADRQGYLIRLDVANPAATAARVSTTSAPEALAFDGGELWVAARAATASHRGGTLRIVLDALPALDPLAGLEITPLVTDGLVAYLRLGGAAGTTLVPNLATAIPLPADGGRSYTFPLRQGLVYSSGEPVRPADFRRAIERSFQVDDDFFDQSVGAFFFGGLVGAEACLTEDFKAVPRCDMSAGVVANEAANTVTFHLTEPDPDFVHKLANTATSPLPEGVPMNSLVRDAYPGTGPYVIAAVGETEIRLARNPDFRPWDTDVRPDGYPDEIVWVAVGDAAAAVAMVERGDADVTHLLLQNRISPAAMAALTSRLPGQLHYATISVTAVTLNTALAPFDNADARRAVNMAIDRAHAVDLRGGPAAAAVTCQVLPVGWPGYEPYCPYTTRPDPSGRWQAPDLEAARRLVESSGTHGARVVVGPVLPFFSDIRDYLVEVLRELGYDASADERTDEDYVIAAHFEENRVQASVWEWFSGELTPGSLLAGFTCGEGSNIGTTNYCDPDFDALVAEARNLQLTDPAAAAEKWAEAERVIVDAAIWAPLLSEGSDFLSDRVGNYQFHYFYGALLDQMWVK